MADQPVPLLERSREDFLAALPELAQQGVDTDFLMREYNKAQSVTGGMDSEVPEGRTGVAGNFLSKPEGSTGWDALRGLRVEPRAGAVGVAQGVEQALTAPGRAAQGTMPAEDMTLEAFGAAGLVGGAGVARRGTDNFAFDPETTAIFGTRGIDNRYEAATMKEAGVDDAIIWEDTGTQFNPVNRQWEREFDSSKMRIASLAEPGMSETGVASRLFSYADEMADTYDTSNQQAIPLEQFVQFDELFGEYPELRDVAVTFRPGDGGSYDKQNNLLTVGLETIQDPDTLELTLENFKSLITHELQHAVQSRDGTSFGSNYRAILEYVPHLKEQTDIAENIRESAGLLPKSIEDNIRRLGSDSPYFQEFGQEFIDSFQNPSEEITLARQIESTATQEAFKRYQASEGEVQARAAEARRQLTESERMETPPSETYRSVLNPELDQFRDSAYAEGGLVSDVSNNAMADYFKASSGMMTEEEFVGKHKVSTKDFEDRFEAANNVDISGAESFKEITGISKGDNMRKQMSFFNEGGMAAPRRDPVSGNEIPPGSSAVEVRDDIDAKLSEGEYVVPADVVRFFGVNFFEQLRAKAKSGMNKMVADDRVGGQPAPAQISEDDMRSITEMAKGGIVDPNMDINGIIDRVVEVAKTNPELQSVFQKRGIMMAEGGLVDGARGNSEPTFNPNNWGTVGSNLANGGPRTMPMSNGGYNYVQYYGPDGTPMMVLYVNGTPAQTIPEGYSMEPPAPVQATSTGGNDRDAGPSITPSGTMSSADGNSMLAGLGDPFKDVDFSNPDAVLDWADGRLTDPNRVGKGAGRAVGTAMLGPLGGAVAGAAGSGWETGRDIAVVNAAARYAEETNQPELAAELRAQAAEATDNWGLSGLVPETMYDGSQIFDEYIRAKGLEAMGIESPGMTGAERLAEAEQAAQGLTRNSEKRAGVSGGSKNDDRDSTRNRGEVSTSGSKSTAPALQKAKSQAGSGGMKAGSEVGSGTDGRDSVGPMNKGGLVTRPSKK